MSLANLVTQYIVQYGFRIMGAILVVVAALFVAKSVGRLFERWLNEQDLEPPLRLLLLRLVKALVVILGLLIALDQLGLQIAPLVARLAIDRVLQGVPSQVASVEAAHIELNQAILQQLQADGVNIPFPQREVRLLNFP